MGSISYRMIMCSNRAAFLAAVLSIMAVAEGVAEPAILTTPRKPFAFSGGVPAGPQDKVWSAVVLASNPKKGERLAAAPAELAPFAAKLSKVFGYEQFEVLGSATKTMDEASERWLLPMPNFSVCARAKREGGGYRLKLEFFQGNRRLLGMETMLGPKSPVFIRGPMHTRGQVIVVFEIKP